MHNFLPIMKNSTLLVALTLLLGTQSIRVLIPSLVLYLYITLHVNVWVVVVMGYGTFALARTAPLLVRWLTPRGAFWVAGAGLMLCRVVEQISTMPAVDVGAAIGGTVCFLWLLPLLFGRARADGAEGMQAFALGFLLGLSLDTTVRGLTGTLDLSWIPGPWPILTIIALTSVFGYALSRTARGEVTLMDEGSRASWVFIGPGLLLFVQALVFQNQGWVAQLTGWSSGAALSWIMLGNVGALFAATYAFRNSWLRSTRWWLLMPGSALTLTLIFAAFPGWTFALGLLVGLVSSGLLLAVILGEIRESNARDGIGRVSFGFGLGLLFFYLLVTLYYVSLLVPVPIPRAALAPAAGMGLMLCALVAAGQPPLERTPTSNWKSMGWSALLMILPVSIVIFEALQRTKPIPETGYPVRVMTYNIHGAYGLDGRQNVEAIAQVIEGADTDVVVLQEIERGWLLEGSTDLLALLARRLNMPYTVMGTPTDPIAGNAILSRYPIVASGQGSLPRLDTLVGRGYLWAQIDLRDGETLRVFTTHLHHEPERGDVRIAQLAALLRAWGTQPQTVLAGDMNALPGSPEIQVILDAGFLDAWAEAGHGEVNTLTGRQPNWRIDWILYTPDLIARNVEVIESEASDHSAVVATIAPRP
jgi:endonuclease/exonuclease/phosphatase family metal-dependent hydrolase